MLRQGYCHQTDVGGDCESGNRGAWMLAEEEVRSNASVLKACLHRCQQCDRCNTISFSTLYKDCSWFHSCDLNRLNTDVDGFFSVAASKASRTRPCTVASKPIKPLEGSRAAYIAWGRARAERHPPRPPMKLLADAAVLEFADDALCHFFTKLSAGNASVAILGGSISYGHGVEHGKALYALQLRDALSKIWGGSVTVSNAALPSTTAGFATLCLSTLLPEVADLVVIEYSWNTEEVAKLENLIEAVRERGSAVLVLDYGIVDNKKKFEECKRQKISVGLCDGLLAAQAADVFHRHNVRHLPMLRAQQVTTTTFRALGPWLKREALRFNASYIAGRELNLGHWMAEDSIHLAGAGHTLLTDLMVHSLWRAGQHCSSIGARTRCNSSRSARTTFSTRCAIGKGLLAHIARRDGTPNSPMLGSKPEGEKRGSQPWAYVVENDKPGLVSSAVGSHVDLRLSYRDAEVGSASDWGTTSAWVNLVYLQSYEHMGIASFSCHHRCSCNRQFIDAHSTARVSLETVAPPMEVKLSPPLSLHHCVLRARIVPNSTSGEHKFKITGLVVTPPSMRAMGTEDLANFVDFSSQSDFRRAAGGARLSEL